MLKRIFGGWSRGGIGFSYIETLIFSTVRDRLPEGSLSTWDRQIETINKIQRLPDGREVDFYRIRNGRPSFNLDLAFKNTEEELLLAITKIIETTSGSFLIAKLWSVKGFIFSIEYEASVKEFEKIIKDKNIKSELLYIGNIC